MTSPGGHALRVRMQRSDFSLDVELAWSENAMVLFGPSGSGKTTLLEACLGLHPGASVSAHLGGVALEDPANGLRVPTHQRQLGWVPQSPTLFPHLDVLGNLRFGLTRAGEHASSTLERAIEVLEIGDLLQRRVGELSGGERQRVALGRAIASGPRALLLDEPLAALDLPLRARVLPYLLRIRDELALPMLYITHDPDEAMILGERVAVLDAGRVVATGAPRDVLWSRPVLPLSETLGIENVIEAVATPDPDAKAGDSMGESRVVSAGGLVLHVPWAVEPRTPLCIGLRAEDITLSMDPPGRISARNVIAGRVVGIEDYEDRVLIHIDAGDRLIARVTPNAAASLGLVEPEEAGSHVHLIVKAHALRRLR